MRCDHWVHESSHLACIHIPQDPFAPLLAKSHSICETYHNSRTLVSTPSTLTCSATHLPTCRAHTSPCFVACGCRRYRHITNSPAFTRVPPNHNCKALLPLCPIRNAEAAPLKHTPPTLQPPLVRTGYLGHRHRPSQYQKVTKALLGESAMRLSRPLSSSLTNSLSGWAGNCELVC